MMAILAHLDLDAFFAAVEELEQPELRRKPLVVGGDPKGRGVVATANYVARRFGIHSAMSCAEALRRCPEAVFVRPRHTLYREYSQAVWSAVREVVPLVERTGLDEGYLDFAGIASDYARARAVAEAVQTSVVRVKPGGTGRPRLLISARLAPLPPSSSRISARPSARPAPKL